MLECEPGIAAVSAADTPVGNPETGLFGIGIRFKSGHSPRVFYSDVVYFIISLAVLAPRRTI